MKIHHCVNLSSNELIVQCNLCYDQYPKFPQPSKNASDENEHENFAKLNGVTS